MNVSPLPRILLILTPSSVCNALILLNFFSTLPILSKITSAARVYFVPWYSCVYPFLHPSFPLSLFKDSPALHSVHTLSHTHTSTHTGTLQ